MKNQILTRSNYWLMAVVLFLSSPFAFAQDGDGPTLEVDINKSSEPADWMSNPLYWVIGGLVLILIIALVARGNRR